MLFVRILLLAVTLFFASSAYAQDEPLFDQEEYDRVHHLLAVLDIEHFSKNHAAKITLKAKADNAFVRTSATFLICSNTREDWTAGEACTSLFQSLQAELRSTSNTLAVLNGINRSDLADYISTCNTLRREVEVRQVKADIPVKATITGVDCNTDNSIDNLKEIADQFVAFNQARFKQARLAQVRSRKADQALAAVEDDQYERAEALATEVLAVDPNQVTALIARAWALEELDRIEEAEEDYVKLEEVAPDNARAWANRADFLNNLERYGETILAATKAIDLNPNYIFPIVERASALLDTKDYKAAIADYTRAIELGDPEPARYAYRGVAYEEDGNLDAAEADYRTAIKLEPDTARNHAFLADLLNDKQQYRAGLKEADIALDLDPDYLYARSEKAEALMGSKRYAEALATAEENLAAEPDRLGDRAWAVQALLALDRPEEAVDHALILAKSDNVRHVRLAAATYKVLKDGTMKDALLAAISAWE